MDRETEMKIRRANLHPVEEATDKGYADGIAAVARVVLEYMEQHPEDVGAPIEDIYDWEAIHVAWREMEITGPDQQMVIMLEHRTSAGLYDRIKEKDPERGKILGQLGMTGFQWGLGFNLAMEVLKLPDQPNPAIFVVDTDRMNVSVERE